MKVTFIILFLILFTKNTPAQHLGFSVDFVHVNMDQEKFLSFYGLALVGGIDIASNISIEGRAGIYPFLEEWGGAEAGLYLNIKIYTPVYLIASLNIHSNAGNSTNSHSIPTKALYMPGAGAGIQLGNHYAFEILYFPLMKKEPWLLARETYNFNQHYLFSVVKADIKIFWQL